MSKQAPRSYEHVLRLNRLISVDQTIEAKKGLDPLNHIPLKSRKTSIILNSNTLIYLETFSQEIM